MGGLGMLRFAILLIAGMFCFESAQAGWLEDLHRKALAERAAKIKESKLPAVTLNKQQIAKLPGATTERSRIKWLGAGRQKDGTTFVCYLTSQTDYFGKAHLRLFTGRFEKDGSYQQSAVATFSDARNILRDCHFHGLVPPVRVGGRLI